MKSNGVVLGYIWNGCSEPHAWMFYLFFYLLLVLAQRKIGKFYIRFLKLSNLTCSCSWEEQYLFKWGCFLIRPGYNKCKITCSIFRLVHLEVTILLTVKATVCGVVKNAGITQGQRIWLCDSQNCRVWLFLGVEHSWCYVWRFKDDSQRTVFSEWCWHHASDFGSPQLSFNTHFQCKTSLPLMLTIDKLILSNWSL